MSDALSILAAAGQAPQTIGLRTDGRAFSFAQLAALTEHRLGRADLAPARTVPFALDGTATVDTVVTLYALLESRRPALLLHPKLTGAERGAALRAVERCADALPADAAAIVLTSGTTGEPRPAVLTRDALLASAAASAANLGWRDDDCWLLAMPIARVGGLSILTRCLIARRTVALAAAFDAAQLPAFVGRHRVTLASLVPTMLARVLDAHPQWAPPPYLRAVLIGGAAAAPKLLERAAQRRLPIVITYGCTETCSQVVATPYERRFETARCGAGRPLAGAQLRVVDGRIEVRGPMRMAGYAGELPLAPQAWFDTGDLGELDADGFLHVKGRQGDLIITGGEKVCPAEVEQVLESFPGITAAGVFGVPNETWGQIVAAALVTDGATIDERRLAGFLVERLAGPKLPRRICLVQSLPHTGAGKPDRAALPALAPHLRVLRFASTAAAPTRAARP
ncbi:MAG: AMP-binding protein [Burkholderiales bacterium]|nr:AMP-binding protein [Burkholderiales bacterium]